MRGGRSAGRTGGADAEHLDGVIDLGVAVLVGHAGGPALDGAALDLLGPPAGAADQVMVVILRGLPAAPGHEPSRTELEQLSPSELRVLRYLPTNLSRPEIANELSVSVNTVNTHNKVLVGRSSTADPSGPWKAVSYIGNSGFADFPTLGVDFNAVYVGTKKKLTPLPKSDVKVDSSGIPTSAKGYKLITGAELFTLDPKLRNYAVPTKGGAAIEPQGVRQAVELRPTLRYDARHDRFVRISDGVVITPEGKPSNLDGDNYFIRDGIVVIPTNAVIPAGFWI